MNPRFALVLCFALFVAIPLSTASAQTAFLEGTVFNKRTGRPVEGAEVRVHENVTARPLPVELAAGTSDGNGFYQFEIQSFLGFPGIILVTCVTPSGIVQGLAMAPLREATIQRNIYLDLPRRIAKCSPLPPSD